MKDILISSFDMEVGGVERSLINLLDNFDYNNYQVELFLFKKSGDFLGFINENVKLLPEIPQYTAFRKSILDLVISKSFTIAFYRILAKLNATIQGKIQKRDEHGYLQMQMMWDYQINHLPNLKKKYDIAISYLWPHHFIAKKVSSVKKIAWIHTDYSMVEVNLKNDLKIWECFDHIIAVSEDCKKSFLKKYKSLESRVSVIENIKAPEFVKKLSLEYSDDVFQYDDRFKIVTVARLSHAKGIDNAVKAMKILIDKGYEIVWYVVGYGGEEKALLELIAKNNLTESFILLGKKINPYPYIKGCNIYVQPSRYEGKAVTVGEAQILSKPVIITNYSTANSQVENGFDGYICELSPEGLAISIEKMLLNPEEMDKLVDGCKSKKYSNDEEMVKLYDFFN